MWYECTNFFKVLVIKVGLIESEIIDEFNKGTYEEALEIQKKLENEIVKCFIVVI